MSFRIGKIDLAGIQAVYTEEARNLVEQRVPDQQGSVFQDLGREPVTVVLEGLLFGAEVLPDLERLRQAQEKAEPLPMSADIAAGTELTEVVIEDFKVRQVAGYAERYRIFLRLREYMEPPRSQAQDDAPVNEAVAADAETWAADSMAASAALEDPCGLADALAENPALLEHMSADDLAGAVADNAAALSADDLGGTLLAVGSLDPDKMGGMLTGLKKKGALGGFMEKFAATGKSLSAMLKGINLVGLAKGIVALFSVGAELIGLLKQVWTQMRSVWKNLKGQDLLAGFEALLQTAIEELEKLLQSITKLVQSLNRVVLAFQPKEEGKASPITALKDLKCGGIAIKILSPVIETLRKFEDFLALLGAQVIQLAGVAALLGMMRPVLAGGEGIINGIGDQVVAIGAAGRGDIGRLQATLAGARGSFQKVLESGQATLDKVLDVGEALLGTDIDFQIFPLKAAFGELRESLSYFKSEIEGPAVASPVEPLPARKKTASVSGAGQPATRGGG